MATSKYVLAIDQGTTGTHVCIVDSKLRVVGRAYREFRQFFPRPGQVEHDLKEIWSTVEACIPKALTSARLKKTDIAAIGITNQRETTGLWRRDGKPLGRAIVWQDRRTSDRCQALKNEGRENEVRRITGLVLDPYFSGTKLEWMLQHLPGAAAGAAAGEVLFGTIDTWLVYKLTGHQKHVTEVSNASRTLLMNLASLDWDASMLGLLNIPRAVLPAIAGSAEVYGVTRGLASLPDGIPVAGMAGDQQAALFGQACVEVGEAKCTYGTGAFLLMNVGDRPVASKHGLLSTVAWKLNGRTTYALEGSSFVAGAAVQWLRDGLHLIKSSREVEALAKTVKDNGGVSFVPALAGLGAPHWKPDARGLFCGLDRGTTKGHLARAVLEGMALQVYDLTQAMRNDCGRDIPTFKVDGGATTNNLLMQFQADLLGVPVVRPKNIETTSFGAALLGGLGAGVWAGVDEIRRGWKAEKTFHPRMSSGERAVHLERWARAVARA